jgi:hypothetical protein
MEVLHAENSFTGSLLGLVQQAGRLPGLVQQAGLPGMVQQAGLPGLEMQAEAA